MNKHKKISTYTPSSSYTKFSILNDRSTLIDTLAFYPPLLPDTSNRTISMSPSLLKKQENEIKSQLSPTFWDRLNEATKRVSSSNTNLYDYNSYSNYQIYKTPNQAKPSQTITINKDRQNGYTASKTQDFIPRNQQNGLNKISNLYQYKPSESIKTSYTQSALTLTTNSDNLNSLNSRTLNERSTPIIPTIEKPSNFIENNQNSKVLSSFPSEDNLLNYLKYVHLNRPSSSRTFTQQSTVAQPPAQPLMNTQTQPQPLSQSRTILLGTKSQITPSQATNNFQEDNSVLIPLSKRSSASSTNLNINNETNLNDDNKLPSTMSSGNIPQVKIEAVQRSKTMTLAEKDRYLKSNGFNLTAINSNFITPTNTTTINSNNNNFPVSKPLPKPTSNGLKNFHKSLSIRSRVNNFYKDFADDKNAYLSSLDNTNSDLNLNNNFNDFNRTPPKTPDEVNENGQENKFEHIIGEINNLHESKSEINLNSNGVSFTTGETGYFPVKNVERVAESETWKLHKSHLLVGNSTSSSSTNLAKQQQAQIQSSITNGSTSQTNGQFINSLDRSASLQRSDTRINLNSFYYSENPSMQKRFQLFPHRSMQSQGTLRFFFSRHGERIDLAFGPQWIDQAFDRSGKYKRVNLNMPTDLPYRQSKREFLGDSPLTEIGQFQARLTGEALGYEGYKIHYCYSSPALRCIQTATQILAAQGLDKIVKIRIEPSVFEFLGWYDKGLPTFLSHESLVAFGYNIDVNYKPLLTLERLQQDENYTDYYQRSFNITKYLSNIHQNEGANILVVGHAGTLEVCTRQITGMPVRPYSEFNATIRKVPYLGLAMLEKEAGNNSFEIQGPVIPALGHTANFNFDPLGLKL